MIEIAHAETPSLQALHQVRIQLEWKRAGPTIASPKEQIAIKRETEIPRIAHAVTGLLPEAEKTQAHSPGRPIGNILPIERDSRELRRSHDLPIETIHKPPPPHIGIEHTGFHRSAQLRQRMSEIASAPRTVV